LAGIASGAARAVIECPFEFAKVKKQTNQPWLIRDSYKGFSNLLPRSIGILTFYYCVFTSIRKKTKNPDSNLSIFMCSGAAATAAWWLMWPFELLKNMAQAEIKHAGSTSMERVKYIYRNQGMKGFYRGIIPGS
jgi:solute carrier family 25 carnitine/acylcarnitine transporter 20/29